MTASIDLTAKLEDGVMWIPATACPICGSIKAACFSPETSTVTRGRLGAAGLATMGSAQAGSRSEARLGLPPLVSFDRVASDGGGKVPTERGQDGMAMEGSEP